MPNPNLEKDLYNSYLTMLKNAEGTQMFRSFFVVDKTTGAEKDVLNDGEYSCAFFVGSVLTIFGILERPHATVKTTIEKLVGEGLEKVEPYRLKAGDVVVWDEMKFEDGTMNEHIGFYLSGEMAISTSYKLKSVVKHHSTFGIDGKGNPMRKIVAAYRPSFKI